MGRVALVLVCVALTGCGAKTISPAPTNRVPAVRFIQPPRSILLSGASGARTFYAQAWVERHPENRKLRVSWEGPNCGGSADMDLTFGERVQPPDHALRVDAWGPGICELIAIVFGPGDVVRVMHRLPVRICGDEDCQ